MENIDSSYRTLVRQKFAGAFQLSAVSVCSLKSQWTATLLDFQSNCALQFLRRSGSFSLGFSILRKRDSAVFNCWLRRSLKKGSI